ncbi:MAG: hypothetical protein K8J31_25970 [Anaerolineae bacterium]|nr:hypothetical protein [Anaerolineae bacterium]
MATLAPKLERRIPRHPNRPVISGWSIPRRVLLACAGMLVMVLAIGLALVVGAMGQRVQPSNPFAAYLPILPDQPLEALKDYPCTTAFSAYPFGDYSGEIYCQLRPEDGVFGLIAVYGKQGAVRSVAFGVENLRLGDVVQFWGEPNEIRIRKHYFSLRWGNYLYASGNSSGRFGYWSPIRYLMVMSPPT